MCAYQVSMWQQSHAQCPLNSAAAVTVLYSCSQHSHMAQWICTLVLSLFRYWARVLPRVAHCDHSALVTSCMCKHFGHNCGDSVSTVARSMTPRPYPCYCCLLLIYKYAIINWNSHNLRMQVKLLILRLCSTICSEIENNYITSLLLRMYFFFFQGNCKPSIKKSSPT